MSWSPWNILNNFINWNAPLPSPLTAAVPAPAVITPAASVSTPVETPAASPSPVKVETPEEKLQRQQADLIKLLNNWSVPVCWVKSFLGDPGLISSLFYSPTHDEAVRQQRWNDEIAALKSLLPVFREQPLDLSALNMYALFVLCETEIKTAELREEILKRMEQEPYDTTCRWYPTLKVHNSLIDEESYKIFFKLVNFRELSPEMKQTVVNRCNINLLVDLSFRSFLEAFDKEESKIYLLKALEKFLGSFTDKAVYLWFQSDKEKIARFVAYAAEKPEFAVLASSAFKATDWEFFDQQLKIHRTAYELVEYVRRMVTVPCVKADEFLQNLHLSLENYPCGDIYTKYAGRPQFGAQRLGKKTLDCLAGILSINPRFLSGVHWVGLVKMWPIIPNPDVRREILDQLNSARRERHDEIEHPFLNREDYESLEAILPQGHEDYWQLDKLKNRKPN